MSSKKRLLAMARESEQEIFDETTQLEPAEVAEAIPEIDLETVDPEIAPDLEASQELLETGESLAATGDILDETLDNEGQGASEEALALADKEIVSAIERYNLPAKAAVFSKETYGTSFGRRELTRSFSKESRTAARNALAKATEIVNSNRALVKKIVLGRPRA